MINYVKNNCRYDLSKPSNGKRPLPEVRLWLKIHNLIPNIYWRSLSFEWSCFAFCLFASFNFLNSVVSFVRRGNEQEHTQKWVTRKRAKYLRSHEGDWKGCSSPLWRKRGRRGCQWNGWCRKVHGSHSSWVSAEKRVWSHCEILLFERCREWRRWRRCKRNSECVCSRPSTR